MDGRVEINTTCQDGQELSSHKRLQPVENDEIFDSLLRNHKHTRIIWQDLLEIGLCVGTLILWYAEMQLD